MAFDFQNLSDRVRGLMQDEVDFDVDENNLHLSSRLSPKGQREWKNLLRRVFEDGSEVELTNELGEPGGEYLNAREINARTGGTKSVPTNAGQTLAEGEFNRYYIRALCQLVLQDGGQLEIYRARTSAKPDPVSQSRIGSPIDALDLLNDLRKNVGTDTALGVAGHPNSGLSVRIRSRDGSDEHR